MGVENHWNSPFETLLSHRGDCEDYAIVKYVALREAGLSSYDVKILILRILFPNEFHAVAAARVNGEWLILDNRRLTLVPDTDMIRATPKFLLDEDGVHRFVPSNPTVRKPNTSALDAAISSLRGTRHAANASPRIRRLGTSIVVIDRRL